VKWTKSSFCADGQCIEVALIDNHVAVRDNKNVDQEALRFSQAEWAAFLDRVTVGQY
jgi:hypothetical protein